MTEILKLSDKDFKVVIKMFKEVMVNSTDTNEKTEDFSK